MTPRGKAISNAVFYLSIAFWAFVVVLPAISEHLHARFTMKDGAKIEGARTLLDKGAETIPVVVLLPAVVIGVALIWKLLRAKKTLPCLWMMGWVAACIYVAGEECSWGQWYFGWETPEALAEINKQKETNLHNTSTWLNEKPRAAVELFIYIFGFFVPVAAAMNPKVGERFEKWPFRFILAPMVAWPSAAVVVLLRSGSWFKTDFTKRFCDSEVIELAVACFLAAYLLGWWLQRSKLLGTSAGAAVSPARA